jgi:catechol 2,3-dioxygenase-like lactoylglutathione lyase family enzyme
VQVETLDHVALWVRDRDALADFLTTSLGMHVIERTERFTLVGSDARRGKLTLFVAEGDREPGALVRVGLRVTDFGAAVSALPGDLALERLDGEVRFDAPEGLGLALVQRRDGIDYDIDHVVLGVREPASVRARLGALGFDVDGERISAGAAGIRLVPGDGQEPARPLLNHLGLLVASAEAHIAEARQLGLEIADIVDAANTYAVFVWGPERIKLEYVEHKASFSLV